MSYNHIVVALNNVPQKVWNDLLISIHKFKYNKELFALARKNIFLDPSIMKMFWNNVKMGFLPSDREICDQVISSPEFKCEADNNYVFARCYQTAASFLREMDVAKKILRLMPGFLVKYVDEDLNKGIDFRFTRYDGKYFEFAVKVDGFMSDYYDEKRKNIKRSQNLIDLVAKQERNNDLYLVSEEMIKNVLSV